ncbi:RNA-binding cell elongation regulator Jag/EloR [Thermohalobacter berrensis]|uniref:RNA-binding protein KhpB n=1 Tax=Thermohalobacter berrensis TaxID=99594 RepID=A0A419T1M4_9FIRM|nr:RNA-binding cell elongation regulator Jag/EloR [Thermohalobacter berrensis]RKD31375.1 DNA-binding protein [Thermohalobacter berrensis]
MRSVVKTGKTVDEAIDEALKELNVVRDDVTVEILEAPSKGFLGLIGCKDAKVKVTLINDPVEIAQNFLEKMFKKMNINARLNIKKRNSNLYINIENVNKSDSGILIGKRGKTLDSIQYLVSLVVNKDRNKYIRVLLDTQNYRKKREQTLIKLAKKMASKAKRLNRPIKLDPMNPYERRIIHSALQEDSFVETYSEGEEPYRRVVIRAR